MPASTSSFDPVEDNNGPLQTEGYLCLSKGSPLTLEAVTLPSLSPTMVQVTIHMIGLCHTDIHMRDNDWGISNFPLLLGHEAVGTVSHTGVSVRTLEVGDRVALTWVRDSCRACAACACGKENLCESGYQGTYLGAAASVWGDNPLQYNAHGGCFSRIQRFEERFAIKLPDGLPAEMACPLLCGGGTMYEPLCEYVSAGSRVGIVGVGGLGTAGIKLGRLRGCVMVAVSRSNWKREGAIAAGANEFVCLENKEEVEHVKGTLDLVLDTTPVGQDIGFLLEFVKFGGTVCRVGIPSADNDSFSGHYIPLIFSGKKVVGSVICGTQRMRHMLQLVAANLKFMSDSDIWKTEHVKIEDVNVVMDRLAKGENKSYRYVLEW